MKLEFRAARRAGAPGATIELVRESTLLANKLSAVRCFPQQAQFPCATWPELAGRGRPSRWRRMLMRGRMSETVDGTERTTVTVHLDHSGATVRASPPGRGGVDSPIIDRVAMR
jgi:hypothetical protein